MPTIFLLLVSIWVGIYTIEMKILVLYEQRYLLQQFQFRSRKIKEKSKGQPIGEMVG